MDILNFKPAEASQQVGETKDHLYQHICRPQVAADASITLSHCPRTSTSSGQLASSPTGDAAPPSLSAGAQADASTRARAVPRKPGGKYW